MMAEDLSVRWKDPSMPSYGGRVLNGLVDDLHFPEEVPKGGWLHW